MKVHQAKISMLLLTAFLTLNLPSIVQSGYTPESTTEGQDAQNADKADNTTQSGFTQYLNTITKEGERKVENEERSETAALALQSVTLQSASPGKHPVSSSRGQLEQAINDVTSCKLNCRQQEVGCLNQAIPSTSKTMFNIFADQLCRNDFAMCTLQCTKDFCGTVTSIPDPPISGEGQDVAMAQQNDEAQKLIRELDTKDANLLSSKGVADFQRVSAEGGIIVTLALYAEYGVPEGQTAIATALQNLTACRLQTETQTSQCNTAALASAGNDSTQFFALSVCGCQLGDRDSRTGLFGQLGCARDTINRFNSFSD